MSDHHPQRSTTAKGAATSRLPPETLLTAADVGEWLKVTPRQVQRLGIPWIDLGRKTRRYLATDVVQWLDARRRTT